MRKINIPRLMVVTQRERMRSNFDSALEAALRGGARLIQLREKDLPDDELRVLAHGAQKLCAEYDAQLLINGCADMARDVGAAGVHLSEIAVKSGNLALRPGALCGVSVHSLEAARRAAEQGADYLVFGSIYETQSHPGAAPAGIEKLREVCAAVDIPVFAIGGVTAQDVKPIFEAGAYGIAVIGAAWDADDVESAVKTLISATDEHGWRF